MSILGRANRRHFSRHPVQLVLAILGVALGVAMVVSIDLAIDSSHRAFELSMQALTGRATHRLTGGPGGLPESLYTQLRVEQGLRDSAPAIEAYVTVNDATLRLLGLDPFAERSMRERFADVSSEEASRLLTDPATVLLSKVTAGNLGIQPGGQLQMTVEGRVNTVTVIGYPEGSGKPDPAVEGVVLADIATAQELLRRPGILDRIDLVLGEDPAQLERIRRMLPPDVNLETASGRNKATRNMTAAFELNLRAMSLLALLVGTFLIYNTIAFSVLQRRELLASLRIVGAMRGQLLREILLEAALLGLVGGAVGVAFGVLAAQGLLYLVTRTINDVYFVTTVTEFMPDPLILLRGLGLGMLAAVAAALAPALEAAWTSPWATRRRSSVETTARTSIPWLVTTGCVAFLLAGFLLTARTLGLLPALIAVFLMLFGYGLIVPFLLQGLVLLVVRLARTGRLWLLRLAVRQVISSVSRSGLAIAALTVAVAVSLGIGIMIESFRSAVDEWLSQILQADIYVATPSSAARHSAPLPTGLEHRLGTIRGVHRTGTGRRIMISTSVGESELLALAPPYPDWPGFRFKHGDGQALWAAFPTLQAIFVSEPYAERHGLDVGSRLILQTDTGPHALPVAGVFFDYRSDQGLIVMHRELYDRLWKDRANTSIGLYLHPGADLSAVRREAERILADEQQPLSVKSNREIREGSLEVFERTFAITRVLRLLAVGVAFVGILSALMAFQYGHRHELAVLRAIGLTPRQTGILVLLQTGFMGLVAGVLALPLGLAVAVALIRVINLRSFGWTMDITVTPTPLCYAVALAVFAALLAGLSPARRAMRIQPAFGLREE